MPELQQLLDAMPVCEFEPEVKPDAIEQYRELGFANVGRVTTDEEIEWLREVYELLMSGEIDNTFLIRDVMSKASEQRSDLALVLLDRVAGDHRGDRFDERSVGAPRGGDRLAHRTGPRTRGRDTCPGRDRLGAPLWSDADAHRTARHVSGDLEGLRCAGHRHQSQLWVGKGRQHFAGFDLGVPKEVLDVQNRRAGDVGAAGSERLHDFVQRVS